MTDCWERKIDLIVEILLTFTLVDNSDNEAVNTENTSHDTGNQRLEYELIFQNTDSADAHTRPSSSVGSTEVGEHKGGGESHESEEGVLVNGGSFCYRKTKKS